MNFKIGQVWRTRNSGNRRVTKILDGRYVFPVITEPLDGDGSDRLRTSHLENGRVFGGSADPCDLIAPIGMYYISGPMTGLPENNVPAFHRAAEVYRNRGIVVVNPAEIQLPGTPTWHDYLRADIAQLVTCDTIVMLDGWTSSRGAVLEHHIAVQLGLNVINHGS